MAVVYEVRLKIDTSIYIEFEDWLIVHMREMLTFPGFEKAYLLKEECPEEDFCYLTVQYWVESDEKLAEYFSVFAPQMRQLALERFQDKFTASRRIYKVRTYEKRQR